MQYIRAAKLSLWNFLSLFRDLQKPTRFSGEGGVVADPSQISGGGVVAEIFRGLQTRRKSVGGGSGRVFPGQKPSIRFRARKIPLPRECTPSTELNNTGEWRRRSHWHWLIEGSETTSLRRRIHCDVIFLVNVHLLEEQQHMFDGRRIPRDRAYRTRDTYDGVVPTTSKRQPYCHSIYIELSDSETHISQDATEKELFFAEN